MLAIFITTEARRTRSESCSGVLALEDKMLERDLSDSIIGSAIKVHKSLGPGILENAYEECLCYELNISGLKFQRQVPFPIEYENIKLESRYRADIVVDNKVIVELKSVEKKLPIHEAQLLTYLKVSKLQIGLLLNFNVTKLKDGLVRRVL